jgi:hypothetical protein
MQNNPESQVVARPLAPLPLDRLGHWLVVAVFMAGVALTLVAGVIHYSRFLQSQIITGGSGDYAVFAETARVVANGGRLYVDYWDTKPPGMFFVLAPFVRLFGNTVFAINAGTVFIWLIFVVAITALAYQMTRSKAAALTAMALALTYTNYQEGPETTFAMMTFGTAAAFFAVAGRGRLLWMLAAGFLFAGGVMCKQPLALELPVLLALALWYAPGRRWQAGSGVLAGGVVCVGLVLAWGLSKGVLEAMWYRNVVISAQYAFAKDGGWHFRDDSLALFNRYFVPHTLPYLKPLLVLAVPSIVLLVRARRHSPVWIVLLWVALAFAGGSLARGWRPPYFTQTLPALIILTALAVPQTARLKTPLQIALVVLGFMLVNGFIDKYERPFKDWQPSSMVKEQPIFNLIAERTRPEDCLWIWGNVAVFNYIGNRNSCASAALSAFIMDDTAFPIKDTRIEYMHNLLDHPPTLHVRDGAWGYFYELEKYADRYLREPLYESDVYSVFAVDASAMHRTNVNFAGEIALVAYDLAAQDSYCPGDALRLAMTWERLQTPTHQYQMFAQLLTPDETAKLAGYDGLPAHERPTDTWVDRDEIVLGDTFDLAIPDTAEAGIYKLVVGLYDVETQASAGVLDANGQPTGRYALLQEVNIGEGC